MPSICTVDDVLAVATIYRNNVQPESSDPEQANDGTISREEVEQIIDEAELMLISKLRPRYNPDTVFEQSDDPPLLVRYCAVLSAVMMFERYSQEGAEHSEKLISIQRDRLAQMEANISGGTLTYSDGTLIPRASRDMVTNPSNAAVNQLPVPRRYNDWQRP